jgi:hypothetical protein
LDADDGGIMENVVKTVGSHDGCHVFEVVGVGFDECPPPSLGKLDLVPVLRLSTNTTWQSPRRASAAPSEPPMCPAPPVTRIFMLFYTLI